METKPYGFIRFSVKVDNVETEQDILIIPNHAKKYNIIIIYYNNDFIRKCKTTINKNDFKFENNDQENICEFNVYNIDALELNHNHEKKIGPCVSNHKPLEGRSESSVIMRIILN